MLNAPGSGILGKSASWIFARANSCCELPYGKTTTRQRLEILSSPILCPLFWRRLWREVILGRQRERFPRLSRITSLVFLLDPGARTVWPNPRLEPAPCVGTVLAHWVLRIRNPRLAIREVPGLGSQISIETELEFWKELKQHSIRENLADSCHQTNL